MKHIKYAYFIKDQVSGYFSQISKGLIAKGKIRCLAVRIGKKMKINTKVSKMHDKKKPKV